MEWSAAVMFADTMTRRRSLERANPVLNTGLRMPIVTITGIICLVYLNSFRGVFQFDDYNVIVDSTGIHSWSAWVGNAAWSIRPILKFAYMINWISGLGIFGFHLFNIGVHATNALLVYWLTFKFTEYHQESVSDAQRKLTALLAAVLFAVHPVQTEAVTYISGRSASLMTLFYLGSLLSYIHGAQARSRWWLYVISPLLFALAVGTKETAMTLPFAVLLWEISVASQDWRRIVKRQAVHWFLLSSLLTLILMHPSYRRLLQFAFESRPLLENLLSQINGIAYLISRLVCIHRLNIDPDLPLISAWTPRVAVQLFGLLGLLAIGVRSYKKSPWVGFGVLWFFLHLLPTNSLVPRLDIANERQLYLASVGVFLFFSVEVQRFLVIAADHRKLILAGLGCLVLILGSSTTLRNHDYRSEVALWEDTSLKSPGKARVFNNLGVAYELAGYPEKAAMAYFRALQQNPRHERASYNLRQMYLRSERYRKRD